MIMLGLVLILIMASVPGDPSGETILKNVELARAGISDFTVTLDIEAHMEQVSVPPMHVTMYFKQPDKVHFDGEGFAIIPKEAVTLNPTHLLKRFTVERVERDTLNGEKEFKLSLRPNDERVRLRSVILYVHAERWTMDRLASTLPEGRALNADFTYQKIEGTWLPAALTVSFTALKAAPAPQPAEEEAPAAFRRPVLQGGSVLIRYSGYRINTGLDDALFTPDRPKVRE
jgi:hypothetical protein